MSLKSPLCYALYKQSLFRLIRLHLIHLVPTRTQVFIYSWDCYRVSFLGEEVRELDTVGFEVLFLPTFLDASFRVFKVTIRAKKTKQKDYSWKYTVTLL